MTEIIRRQELPLSALPQRALLQRLAVASQALSEARTLGEVKDIRDKIAALEGYSRQRDASVEIVNEATRLKLRAERRLGEMLREMPKSKGAAAKRDSTVLSRSEQTPKLKDLGISLTQSSRWQKIAAVPAPVVERKIDEATAKGEEISAKEAMKRARKQTRPSMPPPPPLPADRFDLIYADPPWKTDFERGDSRDVEKHYPTMSQGEINQIDVPRLAHKDCILFLWATSPLLPQALEVMASWGFTYKTSMVWVKQGAAGMGYYSRVDHELVLIGTKGRPGVPADDRKPSSVVTAAKGRHSEKPAAFYEVIEQMYPDKKRLELFARDNSRPGWTFWGNQIKTGGDHGEQRDC